MRSDLGDSSMLLGDWSNQNRVHLNTKETITMLISGKIIVSKLSPDDLVLDIKASADLKHYQVSSDKLYLASLWDRI